MNDLSEIKKQCQMIIQKAIRSLAAAQRNMDAGDYDFASSRAYYTAFYALQAVLLTKNLSFAKHSGVISAFNQYFVKTGVFPKKFSKLLTRLFRERQVGDYDFDISITKNDTQEDIEAAETILNAISKYLADKKFI